MRSYGLPIFFFLLYNLFMRIYLYIRPLNIVSILLQLLTASCMIAGITLTSQMGGGFMAGGTAFLYFTVQSNLWIGATCGIFAVLGIIQIFKYDFRIPHALHIIKYVFTVSITLTGIVFCCVLAPTMPGSFKSAANVLTHVIVPLAAVIDLFICRPPGIAYWHFAFALIPPIYYLIFAGIGYALNWNFGGGNNYPYFFLNWDSPAGAFGFSSEMPYFMGCVWWIILLIIFISGIALGYIALIRKLNKYEDEKTFEKLSRLPKSVFTISRKEENAGDNIDSGGNNHDGNDDGNNADDKDSENA